MHMMVYVLFMCSAWVVLTSTPLKGYLMMLEKTEQLSQLISYNENSKVSSVGRSLPFNLVCLNVKTIDWMTGYYGNHG